MELDINKVNNYHDELINEINRLQDINKDLLDALQSMKIQLSIWNKQSEDTLGYKWAQKAINAINKATK